MARMAPKQTQKVDVSDFGAIAELMAQDRHKLLLRFPFTGAVVMRLDLCVENVPELATAATDGRAIWVNPEFYASLNAEERLFVIAHEAWHCILMHFARRGSRIQSLFNIAADLEIHFLLTKEGLTAPFVLPHDPNWNGLSAEEIYERLPKPKGDGSANAKIVPLTESDHIRSRNGGGFDQHDLPALPVDEGAAEEVRQIVISVAQTIERTQGKLPAHLTAIVEAALRPQLRWQELLAQFVTSCYGGSRRWLPPNRRYVNRGVYLPSSRHERLRAIVALDTSGSTQGDLPRFFTELTSLLKSFGDYELTVIQSDAEIQEVKKFSPHEGPLPQDAQWKAKGLGGTDFRPVFKYVGEHSELEPSLLVFFTDGFGDAPEKAPKYPVLWLLTSDGKPPATWGQVVRFAKEEAS
jgi:predicted metal-dependent peptidase